MKNSQPLQFDITANSDVSPPIHKKISKLLSAFHRVDPVSTRLINTGEPHVNRTSNPVQIVIHSPNVPRPGFSHTSLIPNKHQIHIYPGENKELNPDTGKHLYDSLTRLGVYKLLQHTFTGKKALAKQVPAITRTQPLSSKELRDKIYDKVAKKINFLSTARNHLSNVQNAAYEEIDTHHGRHRKALKRDNKRHTTNNYAPAVSNLLVGWIKKIAAQSPRLPVSVKIKKVLKTTKSPQTVKMVGNLYNFLHKNLLGYNR